YIFSLASACLMCHSHASLQPPPRSPRFPSTTLFRSATPPPYPFPSTFPLPFPPRCAPTPLRPPSPAQHPPPRHRFPTSTGSPPQDRKSTRLNSSHVKIAYAVLCLKKKNYPSQYDRIT